MESTETALEAALEDVGLTESEQPVEEETPAPPAAEQPTQDDEDSDIDEMFESITDQPEAEPLAAPQAARNGPVELEDRPARVSDQVLVPQSHVAVGANSIQALGRKVRDPVVKGTRGHASSRHLMVGPEAAVYSISAP